MNKNVIRVYLMDDSLKSFVVEDGTTVASLKDIIVEKLGIEDGTCFYIVKEIPKKTFNYLQPDDNIVQLINDLGYIEEAKRPYLSFRKALHLKLEPDQPIVHHFTYLQICHDIRNDELPCEPDLMTTLAGIQVQAIYGDHKPSYTVGFLTQRLHEFLPAKLLKKKKHADLENAILRAHRNFSGLTTEKAEAKLIELVYDKILFGPTFFKIQNNAIKKFPEKLHLAVNCDGLTFLKGQSGVITTLDWRNLYSWKVDNEYICFDAIWDQSQPNVWNKFRTSNAQDISFIISEYVDLQVKQIRWCS